MIDNEGKNEWLAAVDRSEQVSETVRKMLNPVSLQNTTL